MFILSTTDYHALIKMLGTGGDGTCTFNEARLFLTLSCDRVGVWKQDPVTVLVQALTTTSVTKVHSNSCIMLHQNKMDYYSSAHCKQLEPDRTESCDVTHT